MAQKKIKNISAIVLLLSAVFGLAFFVSKTRAGTGDNVTGWLWSGSEDDADLVSTNNINGTDGTTGGTVGIVDGNESGLGWISMNNTNAGAGGTNSYGVKIPAGNGDVSGYAWSEHMGWISFTAGDLVGCPVGNGVCSARRNVDKLEGWARILSIKTAAATNNAGGWLGWIKLNGTNYGVDVTKMDGTGANPTYAWSDELGWIDFSRASINLPIDGKCGTADVTTKTYAADDLGWGSDTACDPGNSSIPLTSGNFPAPGGTLGWICNSTTGGESASCLGKRASACPLNNCEASICAGTGVTCTDSCTGTVKDGTKNCQWREVSPN